MGDARIQEIVLKRNLVLQALGGVPSEVDRQEILRSHTRTSKSLWTVRYARAAKGAFRASWAEGTFPDVWG